MDDSPSYSLPPRLLRTTRIAVSVQALALAAVVGMNLPGYLDHLFHPLTCRTGVVCIDLRGLDFTLATVFLGPPTALLLASVLLWNRPRKWPSALPLLVDVAIIGIVLIDLVAFAQTGFANPNIAVQVLLGLVPAAVTLILVLALLRRWGSS